MRRLARAGLLAIVAAASACSGDRSIDADQVSLASLGFDVPAGWQRTDASRPNVKTFTWAPAENPAKQSITVIRTELAPDIARSSYATLERTLRTAQAGLGAASISPTYSLTTRRGLAGARIEIDFTPAGMTERYHRVHVVLVDGTSLVHVLYTARKPDAELTALGLVLDTIRHEEA